MFPMYFERLAPAAESCIKSRTVILTRVSFCHDSPKGINYESYCDFCFEHDLLFPNRNYDKLLLLFISYWQRTPSNGEASGVAVMAPTSDN